MQGEKCKEGGLRQWKVIVVVTRMGPKGQVETSTVKGDQEGHLYAFRKLTYE